MSNFQANFSEWCMRGPVYCPQMNVCGPYWVVMGGAIRQQAIAWVNVYRDLCLYMSPLWHNELENDIFVDLHSSLNGRFLPQALKVYDQCLFAYNWFELTADFFLVAISLEKVSGTQVGLKKYTDKICFTYITFTTSLCYEVHQGVIISVC